MHPIELLLSTMPSNTASLIDLDRAHLIHPVAPWRKHEQRGVTVLESGHGAWLRDSQGHELLDAFAGLWCVNVGYGQESVVRATVAKGLTAGYAPMGAVLMSDAVYAGIADGAPAGVPVGHGVTYSAHPVSAAVALEG